MTDGGVKTESAMSPQDSILGVFAEAETHIFTHHITTAFDKHALERHFPGYRYYDQRALILARPRDLVCAASPVDSEYLKFLGEYGIGPDPDRVIELEDLPPSEAVSSLARALAGRPGCLRRIQRLMEGAQHVVLNPYYASPAESSLAEALSRTMCKPVRVFSGNPDIVARANRKHIVHAKALELSFPMASGEVVELPAQSEGAPLEIQSLLDAIVRNLVVTGKVIVRSTDGGGGSGVFMVDRHSAELERKLRLFVEQQIGSIFLVQAMHDILAAPNVLMLVPTRGGHIRFLGATDQCFDAGLSHVGNVFPSKAETLHEMIRLARILAGWLQAEGYSGFAGFDFVEYAEPETGDRKCIFVEVNARINAAAYVLSILGRMRVAQTRHSAPRPEAIFSTRITTRARTFSQLRDECGTLFYDHQTARGLIPFNTGRLAVGVCDMAFLGSCREEVEELAWDFTLHTPLS